MKLTNAKTYLAFMVASLLVSILAVLIFLVWAHTTGRLAPPPLSGSISFDEKMDFLRRRKSFECDILAAGSSMTLSNLDSEALVGHFKSGVSYLNVAAWGMKVSDTRTLVEYILRSSRPKVVIMVTGTMDFYGNNRGSSFCQSEVLNDYFTRSSYAWIVCRNFDLRYYLKQSLSISEARHNRAIYTSLAFDAWGGVPLQISYPAVDSRRWNEHVQPVLWDQGQYRQLDELASILHQHSINFICVQAPMRRVSMESNQSALEAHWQQIESILNAKGYHLLNFCNKMNLDDSYFADYSHLNARGAKSFTNAFIQATFSNGQVIAPFYSVNSR